MSGLLGVGLLELVGDDVERGTFKVPHSPTGVPEGDGGFSMHMSPLFPALHLKHKGTERGVRELMWATNVKVSH